MTEFNPDQAFLPILAKIECGEMKTTHGLRIALENLEETFNIRALKLLVEFREWLQKKNIELSTEHGIVTICKNHDKR